MINGGAPTRDSVLLPALLALFVIALVTVVPMPPAAAAGGIAVGDSVMLGAKPNLLAAGYEVDAAESRSFGAGLAVLQQRGAALPPKVLLHLGTNSEVSRSQCEQAVATVGSGRQLTLINVVIPSYPKVAATNNAVLGACAQAHDNVTLVDWAAYVAAHPGVVCGDGIHISCGGSGAYTALVTAASPAPPNPPDPGSPPPSQPPSALSEPATKPSAPEPSSATTEVVPVSESATQTPDEAAAVAAAAAQEAARVARIQLLQPGLAEVRRVEKLTAVRIQSAGSAALVAAR